MEPGDPGLEHKEIAIIPLTYVWGALQLPAHVAAWFHLSSVLWWPYHFGRDSQLVGWIVDLLNFSDDAAAIMAAIPQFEASWGQGIFVLGLIGLTFHILQSWRKKSWRKKAVGPDGQEFTSGPLSSKATTKAPPLERQPINQAYEYLAGLKVVKEDGNVPMQIAGLLRVRPETL